MLNIEEVYELHDVIREDLLQNQNELINRLLYYTHKYRSQDRLLDVNVGIFLNDNYQPTVQIYLATKDVKIREQFIMNGNRIVDNNIIIKEYVTRD